MGIAFPGVGEREAGAGGKPGDGLREDNEVMG